MAKPIGERIAVVIPTHNRPQDLRNTIAEVIRTRPEGVRIHVVDDCSSDAEQLALLDELERTPDVVVHRLTTPHGAPMTRQVAFDVLTTDFVICFDDDSHFLDGAPGNYELIVERFDQEPALAVQNMADYTPAIHSDETQAQAGRGHGAILREFCNCSCAIRLAALRQVGGYPRCFGVFGYGEEQDVSLRLLDGGWLIRHFQHPVVVHHTTLVGRNYHRALYAQTLNRLRFLWWYMPYWLAAGSTLVLLANLSRYAREQKVPVRAIGEGIRDFVRLELPGLSKSRRPVRAETIKAYLALPHEHPQDASFFAEAARRPWLRVLFA